MTIDDLVAEILKSPKYKNIAVDFVRRVTEQEAPKHTNFKTAIKAIKNKLHQVGGAYLNETMPYSRWLNELQQTENRAEVLKKIMQSHASTKERLPIVETFFQTTLAEIAPVESVIDVACGLNPLAIPYMPLVPMSSYYAYDIYQDMTGFIHTCLPILGVQGHAQAHDIGQFIPPEQAQVAFVLKTLPCLEQVQKTISLNLLESLQTDYLLVSFPVRSLGGRHKGMVSNYEAQFTELVAGKHWQMQRFEFSTELAFLVKK